LLAFSGSNTHQPTNRPTNQPTKSLQENKKNTAAGYSYSATVGNWCLVC